MTKGTSVAENILHHPNKTAGEIAADCGCSKNYVRTIATSLNASLPRRKGRIIKRIEEITELDPVELIKALNHIAGRVPTAQLLTAIIKPDPPIPPQAVDSHCPAGEKYNLCEEFKKLIKDKLIQLNQTDFTEKYFD